MDKIFEVGTVINCLDGRVQIPVNNFLRENYGLDYIDTVTEAGPVKIIANNLKEIDSIIDRVKISIERNKSRLIAVAAHYDCRGNPASDHIQQKQLAAAFNVIQSWNFDVEYLGLWIDKNWQVKILHQLPRPGETLQLTENEFDLKCAND